MEERFSHRAERPYHSVVANDSAQVHAGDVVNLCYENTGTSQDQKCCQVFKTSTYEDYKDRNPSRVDGTCQWVLNHPQFRQWRQSKHGNLLWVSADPGCGKSVLAKSLVDRDLDDAWQSMVCYFFFKDNEEQDNLATALCALLHQLFTQQPDLIRHALPTWERNGEKLQRETREMWRILQQSAADPTAPSIICVLDALDECRENDRRQLISFLCDLFKQSKRSNSESRLKFLVTSRPYDSVQRWFEDTTSQWPHIRLRGEDENEQIHQEINLVIDKQVEDLSKEFALSRGSQERLQHQLLQMQHRTYLWLHLAMEEVRETYRNSLYPDMVVIDSLPPSVEEAYERLLQKISDKQRPNARQILLIIAGARRPLTVGEMAWALGAARAQQLESESLIVPNTQHLERQIRQWCGLFVFIQHSTLFLIHQTAKEFLLSDGPNVCPDPSIWRASLAPIQVETEMVKLCTTYLCVASHATKGYQTDRRAADRTSTEAQEETLRITDGRVGFFKYCAEYWGAHLQDGMVANDPSLLSRVLTLYNVESDLFDSWFDHFWKILRYDMNKKPRLLRQHAVACNGHKSVMEYLYERHGFNLDAQDSQGTTALYWAAKGGHLDVSKWLLERGAKVNAKGQFDSALRIASLHGYEKVVQMLLDRGADANARGAGDLTALETASRNRHEKVVQILLDRGADVNARGGWYRDALHAASFRGNEKVVQMLLERGADNSWYMF